MTQTMPAAEAAIIKLMMVNAEARATALAEISAEDFAAPACKAAYEAIKQIAEAGMPVHPASVSATMAMAGQPETVYGVSFGTAQADAELTDDYIRIIKEASRAEKIRKIGREIAAANAANADATAANALGMLNTLLIEGAAKSRTIAEATDDALARLNEIRANPNASGMPTGYGDIDQLTHGMQPGEVTLIAARPSMGKTALALNIAAYSIAHGKRVAVASLEMTDVALVTRMLSMTAGADSSAMLAGTSSAEDIAAINKAAGRLKRSGLHIISDATVTTVSGITAACQRIKAAGGLDLVIIDYLQLMAADGRHDGRQNEVAAISRAVHQMARALQAPVILLSQLSRAVEGREDKHPMLSDLRDSGAIEQDADVVLFLYRDDYYHTDSDRKGIAEVIIAKNRNGATGRVALAWRPEVQTFSATTYRL